MISMHVLFFNYTLHLHALLRQYGVKHKNDQSETSINQSIDQYFSCFPLKQ